MQRVVESVNELRKEFNMADNPYQTHRPASGGGGLYLKLQDGDSHTIRIYGEPVVFNNEYDGNVSTRYAWIVWNYDSEEAQILQLPPTAYKQFYDLATGEWGDPATYDVMVKREGTGLETRYSIQPKPKSKELTKEQIAACGEINLIDMIGKSPGASNICYISEVDGKTRQQVKAKDVVADVPEEDINVSDIPF